jgi:hypothetical protein
MPASSFNHGVTQQERRPFWDNIMDKRIEPVSSSRRRFISAVAPACALTCFEATRFHAVELEFNNLQDLSFNERIKTHYCKSYEELWRGRYDYYIETMFFLSNELGKAKLLGLLKKQFDDFQRANGGGNPNNSFSRFVRELRQKVKVSYHNMLESEVLEDSEEAFELRTSHCLWAKTFCEQNAGDIGYATICYGDFAKAAVYSPRLHLRLTKTLMTGNECCNHRYTWGS